MSAQQENLFVLADVKEMNVATLLKTMKALTVAMKTVTTELEIKSKAPKGAKAEKGLKAPKALKAEKAEKKEKVKGLTPPHLMKNNAWVTYAKTHARENGWEEFNIHQKDGDVTVAASVFRDGVHVHDATGKPMIQKEAMSYAKYLWSAKTGTGAHKEVYDAFEAVYGLQQPQQKKAEWDAPVAGNVKAWTHEGETYLRDNENHVWHALQGGELGSWVGIYDEEKDAIEEAEEPLYEDE